MGTRERVGVRKAGRVHPPEVTSGTRGGRTGPGEGASDAGGTRDATPRPRGAPPPAGSPAPFAPVEETFKISKEIYPPGRRTPG